MTDDAGAYGYLYRLAREVYPDVAQLRDMVARRSSPEERTAIEGANP